MAMVCSDEKMACMELSLMRIRDNLEGNLLGNGLIGQIVRWAFFLGHDHQIHVSIDKCRESWRGLISVGLLTRY